MSDNTGQWVTYYRVWHDGLQRWLLVQKRDGETRVITPAQAAREAEAAPVQPASRNPLTLAA